MSHTIKLTRIVSDQFIYDIMVTAVESGVACVWFWSDVTDIKRDEKLNVLEFTVTPHEHPTSEALNGKSYVITSQRIASAIQCILAGDTNVQPGSSVMEYIASSVAVEEAGDIDSDAADCIVQVACFMDVHYG